MKLIEYLVALCAVFVVGSALHSIYHKSARSSPVVHWIGNPVVSKYGSDLQPSKEIEIGLHTNGTVVWRKKQ